MPFVELSPGLRLFYLEENPQGYPGVLLLHGLGANSASWQLQIPALVERGFRVLAIDTPGFGRSTYPGHGANPGQAASQIASLLHNLCFPVPLMVVGISMGGTQSLQLALDYPNLVERLVLVNTFAHLPIAKPTLLPYYVMRFILIHTLGLEYQARQVANRLFPLPEQALLRNELIEQVKCADPRAYRAWMRSLAQFDVRKRLGELHAATLVITGSQDTTVPAPTQAELTGCIRGAKLVIIEEAGHAVSVDHPDEFNHALINFLASPAR